MEKLTPVGNAVNVKEATYTNAIGAPGASPTHGSQEFHGKEKERQWECSTVC